MFAPCVYKKLFLDDGGHSSLGLQPICKSGLAPIDLTNKMFVKFSLVNAKLCFLVPT